MKNRANGMAEVLSKHVEATTKLTETEQLQVALAQSQLNQAQTLVALRQTELNVLSQSLVTKYGEGGKYTVQSITDGVVHRQPVEQNAAD